MDYLVIEKALLKPLCAWYANAVKERQRRGVEHERERHVGEFRFFFVCRWGPWCSQHTPFKSHFEYAIQKGKKKEEWTACTIASFDFSTVKPSKQVYKRCYFIQKSTMRHNEYLFAMKSYLFGIPSCCTAKM